MKNVIYKYVYLNRKNLLLGVLCAFFFGTIAFDSNKYYSVAMLMAPSLLFSFVVGKMCYEEDSKSTKEFLLSLPMQKNDIVLEKNIVGQICILVGFLIINIMFGIANAIFRRTEFYLNIYTMLIIACFLIVYNTIYIFLNYKFDYSKTQFSSYIIFVLTIILFKFGNEFIEIIRGINSYLLIVIVIFLSSISIFFTKKYKWNL